MPPEAPKPTDEQLLPANTSDFQAAEATKVESSKALLAEVTAASTDMYRMHQGAGNLLDRSQRLVVNGALPGVELVSEVITADKPSVRVLDRKTGRGQVVSPDGTVTTTMPPPGGTLEYNPNAPPGQQYVRIEGNPATRTVVPEAQIKDDPVGTRDGANGEQIQTFADGRIVTTFKNAGAGERATLTQFPQVPGRNDRPLQIETFNPNPTLTGEGSSAERRAGRTVSRFGDRTETTFTPASNGAADQLRIGKVTAFKPGDPQNRALITEYAGAGRPEDGATRVTRFRDQTNVREQAEIPIPAAPPLPAGKETKTKFADNSTESSFDPQKGGVKARLEVPGKFVQEIMVNGDVKTTFDPPQMKKLFSHGEGGGQPTEMNVTIKSITRSANGEYRIMNQNGEVGQPLRLSADRATPADRPPQDRPIPLSNTPRTGDVMANGNRTIGRTGDIAATANPGDRPTPMPESERVAINPTTSMPDRTRVGDTTYTPRFGDNGKVNELTIKPKDGPEVKLTRSAGPPAGFDVVPPLKGADGRPLNGDTVLDGFKVKVENGRIVGDFHVNKRGEVTYKTGDGPDRIEQIKKADGSLVKIDMKNYERTEVGPPPTNTPRPTKFWDGFEWRVGEKKPGPNGGTIVEFTPKPGQPGFQEGKPSVLERNGTPPNDTASVKFKDAAGKETKVITADWTARTQTEVIPANPGPPPTAARTINRADAGGGNYRELDGAPVVNGDNVTYKFKPGRDNEPLSVTFNKRDRTSVTDFKDTSVKRDAEGRVTEIQQPKGTKSQTFAYDGDGDLKEHVTFNRDGSVKEKLIRQGQEKAPMMGAAVADGSPETVGQPGRRQPPRKVGEPTGFNTWRREPAPNPATAENPATIQQNIFVTGDGAIIREKPPAPGSTAKADVSIEHPGRGTTETTRGNQREFKGPDGQAWTSTDGQNWKLPGLKDSIAGTPRSLADGTTVIRATRPIPGAVPPAATTREVDLRRNEDPTSPSISELSTTTGKETERRFDNGTVVQYDEAGNPRTRTVPGTPPTVQNFKFTGDKCTEISTGNPAVVTHKMEGGVLKPVNPKQTDLPVEVTKEGRILERTPATANPPNGTIERLASNVSLVSDQTGNPVRMERQNGAQTETWNITSHRDSRNRVVVDKVVDLKSGRVIADTANGGGAIRLDGTGAVTQESVKGSGNFDRLTSLDGRVRLDTPQRRENTNDKFALNVDVAANTGTLKPKDGPVWNLNYKPGAPKEGDLRELDKVTIPGNPAEVIQSTNGPPKVTIKIDENTGQILVDRGETQTLFNAADPTKHRIDTAKDGSSVTTNRDGLRTSLRNATGEFKITEVRLNPVPAPPLPPTEITEIAGPGPNGTPKLSKADGPITIDAANTITQRSTKNKQEVQMHADGRVVTTAFSDDALATRTGTTIDQGNRRTKLKADGSIEQVLSRPANGGDYRAWEFTPADAMNGLKFGPNGEVKLPAAITKVKLGDGTEVTRGTGEDLVLRENGTLVVRRPVTPGALPRETVFNSDGTANEVIGTGATQWSVRRNTTDNKITSVRQAGERRDIPIDPSLTAAINNNNELIITNGGQIVYTVKADGQIKNPAGQAVVRRRGAP